MVIDKNFFLLLGSSGLGDGEVDLGEDLKKSWLQMLLESGLLPARIVCMNSGIFLTTNGSPVIDIMKDFERQGVKILTCGTCLDYYDRRDGLLVGEPTNMKDTVAAMLAFGKVIVI